MNVNDEELIEMMRGGAKIARRGYPEQQAPEAPKAPDPSSILAAELQSLTKAMIAAVNRPLPTPNVKVSAPSVSVESPTVNVSSPKVWEFEITERDNTEERRIKKFTARAVG